MAPVVETEPGRHHLDFKSFHVSLPGVWRYSAAIFLGMLILLYLTEPYVEGLENGRLFRSVTFTLVLLFGAMAIGGRRALLIWAGVLFVPTVLLIWMNHLRPDAVPTEYPLGMGLLLVVFISVGLLRYILTASTVNSEVLCAAVATYLVFGLAWMFAYTLLWMANPQAFGWTVGPGTGHKMNGFTAMYFSMTTQSTLGYGDIVPLSSTARLLAMVQAVAGMFYMTLLVARLVSVYSSEHKIGKP